MARLANAAPNMYTEDIDPSSSQLIGLYIKTSRPASSSPAVRTPTLPTPTKGNDTTVSEIIGSLAKHLTFPSDTCSATMDTTSDQILHMSLSDLEQMRSRVTQLESCVRGLLKRVYGEQSLGQNLAWLYHTDLISDSMDDSEDGRSTLYYRYRRLMEIARQPVIPGLLPTHDGTSLLQEYGTQLMMLESDQSEVLSIAGNSDFALLRSRPGSGSSNRHAPFKIDKTSNRPYRYHISPFDAEPRSPRSPVSPVECNATLMEYQKQLGLLETENRRRLGESDIFEYNNLSYDEQLAVLKARNEKRLRLKNSKHTAERTAPPKEERVAMSAKNSSSSLRSDRSVMLNALPLGTLGIRPDKERSPQGRISIKGH
ncbi:uncharacterized protein AB675_2952 [Cyphellophora attinorum]|uniref:Uncharacterized protein n=1 Tax=Cyphellophora attinorum TaxID=1664694 RepID=A0A0N0NJ06_9EURO|nr:uncharacterized protein AB675_2952 [Phialophora attinorum]KPI36431.1 hypothetical protein AB675_2952 [Phialophora attinorum]